MYLFLRSCVFWLSGSLLKLCYICSSGIESTERLLLAVYVRYEVEIYDGLFCVFFNV
jgi:hypothetical protein